MSIPPDAPAIPLPWHTGAPPTAPHLGQALQAIATRYRAFPTAEICLSNIPDIAQRAQVTEYDILQALGFLAGPVNTVMEMVLRDRLGVVLTPQMLRDKLDALADGPITSEVWTSWAQGILVSWRFIDRS